MSEYPNTNCLEGMRCPQCKQYYMFRIIGEALFEVSDDGTGDYSSVEWWDDNHASCPQCDWTGMVKDLREENQRSEEPIT